MKVMIAIKETLSWRAVVLTNMTHIRMRIQMNSKNKFIKIKLNIQFNNKLFQDLANVILHLKRKIQHWLTKSKIKMSKIWAWAKKVSVKRVFLNRANLKCQNYHLKSKLILKSLNQDMKSSLKSKPNPLLISNLLKKTLKTRTC